MSLGSEAGLIFGSETMFPSVSNSASFQSPTVFFHVRCDILQLATPGAQQRGVYRYIYPKKSVYLTNFYVVIFRYRASVRLSNISKVEIYTPPQKKNEIPGYAPEQHHTALLNSSDLCNVTHTYLFIVFNVKLGLLEIVISVCHKLVLYQNG